MPTLPDLLSEIKKRADEATPGEWIEHSAGLIREKNGDCDIARVYDHSSFRNGAVETNSKFIAHSRTDVPRLVAALKLAIGAMEENAYQDEYMQFEADLIKILSTDPNS